MRNKLYLTQTQQTQLLNTAQVQCTVPVDMYSTSVTQANMYKLVAQFAKRFNYNTYTTIASVIVVFMQNNNIVAYYDTEQMYGWTA